MTPPKLPADEPSRLASLHRLGLLDTPPEPRFDRFVRMARRLLDVPMAAVSLVDRDRQWSKASSGIDIAETPREVSFCGYAILCRDPMIVHDARRDPRFAGNPLVEGTPRVRFYAGVPLIMPDGHSVGTLCVLDPESRTLASEDLQLLQDLGGLVTEELAASLASTTDRTTGLLDRHGFDRASRSLLETCRDRGTPAVLLHVALDLLELIDEAHGHAEGERALVEMGEILTATFRQGDLVARIGSEHFCALCPEANLDDVHRLIHRLERRIEAANVLRGNRWPLTFRVSHALYDPLSEGDWMELLAVARPERPRVGNTPEEVPRR